MIERTTLARTWHILEPGQRRALAKLLAVIVAAALASAGMVASIFPFLSVLSNPGWGAESPLLTSLRAMAGLEDDYAFTVAVGCASIAMILLGNTLLVARTYATVRFSQLLTFELSRSLVGRYLAQPYTFAIGRHSGDLAVNVLSETGQVVNGFVRPLTEAIATSLTLVAILVAVVTLQPLAGATAFALIGGLYAALLAVTRRRVRRYGERRAAANEARYRIATEAFGGMKDVKLLGLERAYVDRFSEPAREVAEMTSLVGILSVTPRFVMQAAVFSGIVVVCLIFLQPRTVGTDAALGGLLPALGLLAFAAQRAMPELSVLYGAITQMRFGAAAIGRVWRDFEATADSPALPEGPPAPLGLRQTLRLENVGFRYPEAQRAGISDVTLAIGAGERIGVIGATGAGKTTLADLLLGLLRPQSGRLLVDGREIDADTLRAWQRSVGYVPQDIFLTDASVAENIALGIPPERIDRDRMERSARLASLHDFVVSELPRGYDTPTGERGVRLSGGQRQRIGIARALYHDADLIVLDEATSALDGLTEREVMEAIDALPGEKTVVMIAHRLSTLRRCDRIVMLEAGRIVAVGPWDRLWQDSPAFRAFASQSGMERLEATG
jgi:ABC-type multidrug transport system fused ATPase/permease subunit